MQQALIGADGSVQNATKHRIYTQRFWLAFVFSCCAHSKRRAPLQRAVSNTGLGEHAGHSTGARASLSDTRCRRPQGGSCSPRCGTATARSASR